MSLPVTTIDRRYSDPSAAAVAWEESRQALAAAELFWLSTVRADGQPHVTPVVAVWTEGAVWFSTGVDEQKAVNLRSNPQVVLTTGCHGWDTGLDLVVEGEARQVTDDTVLNRVAEVFASRWDGRWQFVAADGYFRDADGRGEAMVFAVTPVKVFGHAKGDPFGATRYLFRP